MMNDKKIDIDNIRLYQEMSGAIFGNKCPPILSNKRLKREVKPIIKQEKEGNKFYYQGRRIINDEKFDAVISNTRKGMVEDNYRKLYEKSNGSNYLNGVFLYGNNKNNVNVDDCRKKHREKYCNNKNCYTKKQNNFDGNYFVLKKKGSNRETNNAQKSGADFNIINGEFNKNSNRQNYVNQRKMFANFNNQYFKDWIQSREKKSKYVKRDQDVGYKKYLKENYVFGNGKLYNKYNEYITPQRAYYEYLNSKFPNKINSKFEGRCLNKYGVNGFRLFGDKKPKLPKKNVKPERWLDKTIPELIDKYVRPFPDQPYNNQQKEPTDKNPFFTPDVIGKIENQIQ